MNSWYEPLTYKGKKISGAAALNARIALSGGMDAICHEIAFQAASNALQKANQLAEINHIESISYTPPSLQTISTKTTQHPLH